MSYELSTELTVALMIAAIWDLIWKGFALWRSARSNQPVWFTSLLVVNSIGILPIVYLATHRQASKKVQS